MTQLGHVSGRSTAVFTDDDGRTKCVYHSTPVAEFDQSRIYLNTGGWRSLTTKTRMNQFSNQFKLGYSVYQKDFDWFVSTPQNDIIPFTGQCISFPRA